MTIARYRYRSSPSNNSLLQKVQTLDNSACVPSFEECCIFTLEAVLNVLHEPMGNLANNVICLFDEMSGSTTDTFAFKVVNNVWICGWSALASSYRECTSVMNLLNGPFGLLISSKIMNVHYFDVR
jgi:hypothetical protein